METAVLKKGDKRLKLSYRDYVLFPDCGSKLHEIIDGEHYITPSPRIRHQEISRNLEWIIESYLKKNRVGVILDAPCDVLLSNTDIVVPDLIYISNENKNIITRANIQGAPDLIIEILSPSNRIYDLELKRDLYEKYGVKEYWIIDPDEEMVEVYSLSGHRYPASLVYKKDQIIKAGIIPGLELALKEVFS